jgi:hypothetical protein
MAPSRVRHGGNCVWLQVISWVVPGLLFARVPIASKHLKTGQQGGILCRRFDFSRVRMSVRPFLLFLTKPTINYHAPFGNIPTMQTQYSTSVQPAAACP